jgi:hypothetical protein
MGSPQTALTRDAYFSVNSTYQRKRGISLSPVTGLPIFSRKSEHLRWLNSLAIDLDDGHGDRTFQFAQLYDRFLEQLTTGGIPDPNFIVSSGRGLWALWLIHEHSNIHTPVKAFAEKRELLQRINAALARRFYNLGADCSIADPARVMRVPGSVNSSAVPEQSVVTFFHHSERLHSLPEMASVVCLHARPQRLAGERAEHKNEAKVRAGRARWLVPLEGFRRLWKSRSHFEKGTRRNALWTYAYLLRKNRALTAEIECECVRLARCCRPRLATGEVRTCVQSGTRAAMSRPHKGGMSNETIIRRLRITETREMT